MRDFEYEMNDMKKEEKGIDNSIDRELADEVYIFCPEINTGVMFYNNSPSGAIADFAGTLPVGKFWYGTYKKVEWNNEVNGIKDNNLPVSNDVSLITNIQKKTGRTTNGSSGSYNAVTIMVSYDTFLDVVTQLKNPTNDRDNRHYVLDLKSKIYNKKDYILDSEKKELNDLNKFIDGYHSSINNLK